MKDGVMIINTSRGGLLDSNAAIEALKTSRIGALGLDVYEEEEDLFFEDKSNEVITDDVFRRLSACHNVLFTGHQAFLTRGAARHRRHHPQQHPGHRKPGPLDNEVE
jgi:D-lactate dehydrogenase